MSTVLWSANLQEVVRKLKAAPADRTAVAGLSAFEQAAVLQGFQRKVNTEQQNLPWRD
ncbi:hypothetical protein B5M42_010435 [Paenibacillus athensensis]|uniref:hypothetical protein n=1 Tax=Paenibacillus athensensis TaxID=1967502 RepID=UPI00142FCE50|nr:hypothetical protein [Paenibacillus athensensis]MCD1259254.1 hypothetical protein [Paenibacillus athensensis]